MTKKCCHVTLNEEAVRDVLSKKGINRTKVKVSILLEISQAKKPLSVNDIHSKLKESCDVSTVFRTVSQFKEKGLVHEVNLEEGFYRYEMASDLNERSDHHHHHVRCRVCGDIRQIEHCDLAAFEKAIQKLGFTEMEHRLEFSGVCSKCSD
ncbi:MAG: Fur family transcriptional regulator [Bacteriovoracia bacterium]